MPNTTRNLLPYPTVGTSLAGDGNLVAQSLAETLDTRLDIVDIAGGVGKRVNNLCMYSESVSNGTGLILIQTNLASNSLFMTTLYIKGFVYEPDNAAIDLAITFYPFTDSTIVNAEVINSGSFYPSTIQILNRNSDGKVAIALTSGAPSAYWQYPKIVVDGLVTHTHPSDATVKTGWSISRVANLTGYTVKSTPLNPRPAAEDSGWITPTLQGGHTQYNMTDFPCQYRRKGGIVHIRGLIIPSAETPTATIFTLPVGFRPYKRTLRGAVDAAAATMQLYVMETGIVNSANTPTGGWLSLEGITFPAEA